VAGISGVAESGKATADGLSAKTTESAEYVKSTGNDAASKAYKTAQTLKDKAYGGADNTTVKT
jgi:hypothetical protein